MARPPKPEPVVVATICSECGLPWEDHGENPTLADCVKLLKALPRPVQYIPYYPNTWQPQWTYTYGDTVTSGTVTMLNRGDDEDPPDALAAVG